MTPRPLPMATALLAVALACLTGCEKPPGELYIDTSIRDLLGEPPGLYELYAPLDIPARGENLVFLRQNKDVVIAAGDSLQYKLDKYRDSSNFSLIGRRMGQPKIWFAVDGIIVSGRLAEPVHHRMDWRFPEYEAFDPARIRDFTAVDLTEYGYRDDRRIRRELIGKKVRVTGTLLVEELAPDVKRYRIGSRDLKMDLTPVSSDLGYFLDLLHSAGTPFVAYGELGALLPLDDGSDSDRESTRIVGPFHVKFLRYSRDILVPNPMIGG